MGGAWASFQKASDKIFSTADSILRDSLPRVNTVLNNASALIDVTKLGVGIAGLKFLSDMGVSWCRSIKLIGISSDAGNDLKKIADHTIKTEDEIVNVLKNISGDLKSSVGLLTEDVHKMGQDFSHMTESLSQSSAEVSGAVNQASRNFGYITHITSDFLAYLSQDMYQNSRCFRVTCFSLTTSVLATAMTYLQNSSCDRDPESTLCTAPLKSMAATTIAAGFLAMTLLMPNRVSNETTSECLDLDFFIPEEGIDQNIEWTKEQLDFIKAKNFDVFSFMAIKKQFGSKWYKQELEWLLSQNENLFLKMLLSWAYTTVDHPDPISLEGAIDLDFFIPEEGIDQNVEWTKEQLDSIKSTNFAVFKYIEMKRQFGDKWHRQELKWLLSQDKNLFLKVILNRVYAISDCLNDNN